MINMKICNHLKKLNSVLIILCTTPINIIITIFPELLVYTDIKARLFYFIIIPLLLYVIFRLLIYKILIWYCYYKLERYIKKNTDVNDQCIYFSGIIDRAKNENLIKQELKEYLERQKYQYQFSDLELELVSFIRYIKKLKKK